MTHRLTMAVLALVAVTPLVSCGESHPPPPRVATAAEPQTAPPLTSRPPGTIIQVGDTPEGVVIDDTTHEVVVALRRPDSLAFVDLSGAARVRRVSTPGRARHLRLLAAGGPVLLPGEDVNALVEIALPAGGVVARFPTGRQPHDAVGVAGRIWVTDELAGQVTVLGKDGRTLPAGLQPGGLAAAGGRVAVADVRGNMLYVFDAAGERRIAVLPAGAGPTHVVQVGPTTVAVADTRGNAILLYALDGKPRQLYRLPLPGGPYGLAADLARHQLWVALSGRNQLVRIDVSADRLRESGIRLATVRQPNSLAVSAATDELAVAGATDHGSLQLLAGRPQ